MVALDTCKSAAIAGSEGRKILVASVPIAANEQINAILTADFRSGARAFGFVGYASSCVVKAPILLCPIAQVARRNDSDRE
jgi:hypothetical protein